MEAQTKFFVCVFFLGFVASLFIFHKKIRRKKRELKLKKIKELMDFSLIELIKIRKLNFLEEEKIAEILQNFKDIERYIDLILKLKSILSRSLYSVTRRTMYLSLNNNVSFLASKELTKKMMRFIYENALKPHIFENWWFNEKDEVNFSIDVNNLDIQDYYFSRTEFLENDFKSLIPVQLLKTYSRRAINSLDISSEDELINNFFSEKDNWPKWIENTQEIKIVELLSRKIEGNVRGVFWLFVDSIANRIRYKLWEGFIIYLLNYFDLKNSDISKWNNIEKVREIIYEKPQTCYELPKFLKPVIEEILKIAKRERKEKYQRFLNLNKI